MPMFGDGKQAMQPVFVDDVGRVVAEAALSPAAANQLFELGGPEVMSMNDVLKTALDVKGRKRFILHQPIFVGRAIGKLASLQPFVTPPLSADAIDFIANAAVADNGNLERALQPQLTPLRAGLETYLKR
jgi:NADH dehydrogenase